MSQVSAHGPASGHGFPSLQQTGAQGQSPAPEPRACRDDESEIGLVADRESPSIGDSLDPLICQLAMNQGLPAPVQMNSPPHAVAPVGLPLREDLQNMLIGLARRAAWGGDRRRGSARIELSEGALAGATLHVHTEQRTVRVELELPPGVSAQSWQERIAGRLEGRGFSAHVRVG